MVRQQRGNKMATAPKAAPKVVPIDENVEAPAPKKSSKKRFIVIGLLLLVLGVGGGGAWFFLGSSSNEPAAAAKAEPPKPPVFLPMEQFTVNLQSENGTDQFLQVAFTLQLADQEQVELIKTYMPLVRSRLLLLLSSKKASEISGVDGKKKLSEEIIAQVKQPFLPQGTPQAVTGVFFTSFVIQ
jgi:flagellar protein FliL